MSRPFLEFLRERNAAGPSSIDEAMRAVLPLLRQIEETHGEGRVAPLDGVDHLREAEGRLWFEVSLAREPRDAAARLRDAEAPRSRALEVAGESRQVTDVGSGRVESVDLRVAKPGEEVSRPVHLPGFRCWEHLLGHHDARTDLFSAGMILASCVLGLNLAEPEDLATFVARRENLFALRPHLHPVVAQVIVLMTELDRQRRGPGIAAAVQRLERYREVSWDVEFDVSSIAGFHERDDRGKREVILGRLRERLFEISRRNRLLFFRPTAQSVHLTFGSVPLFFDPATIEGKDLLTWNGEVEAGLSKGAALTLNRYLRLEEAPYLPPALDRIRAEARRDAQDFGFAQLRLVAAFLRWHDLKGDAAAREERIHSPLVLLPCSLVKRKGVQDVWVVEPQGTVAEVNPVLRHHLRQLYGIVLPESIDLAETDLAAFHSFLESQIAASQPGVTLDLLRKPRIQLLHAQARRRLERYLRRARVRGPGARSWREIDYSYDREDFRPLGLRLFLERVRPSEVGFASIVTPPPPRLAFPDAAPETAHQAMAAFGDEGGGNPYRWEVDLCAVTLANFRYRRISLVRDYDTLLGGGQHNGVFDALFSLDLRPRTERPPRRTAEQDFTIVPCDPTQGGSIDLARAGKSYIIQGPPGTGKSQTITNLIADYLARDLRVLFVCQKRAAIDVVFHRLRQQGLDALCCLVHDALADKKEVIQDLKATYEGFLAPDAPPHDADRSRATLLARVARDLEPLERFDAAMGGVAPAAGVTLRTLLHRLVSLRGAIAPLAPAEAERLPDYALWERHRDGLQRLGSLLADTAPEGMLAHHPLRMLAPRLVAEERPVAALHEGVREAARLLALLVEAIPGGGGGTLAGCRTAIDTAGAMLPLAERSLLGLLDPASAAWGEFAERRRGLALAAAALETLREENRWWRRRFSPAELQEVLALARSLEGRFGNLFRPSWWRLRRVMHEHYDLGKHIVPPSWVAVLEGLSREQAAEAALQQDGRAAAALYRWDASLDDLALRIEALRSADGAASAWQRRFVEEPSRIPAAAGAGPLLARLRDAGSRILVPDAAPSLDGLRDLLDLVAEAAGGLPDFLPCLGLLGQIPEEIAHALRSRPLSLLALEGAIAAATLDRLLREDGALARFDGRARREALGRVEQGHAELKAVNATWVLERARRRFLDHAAPSPEQDKEFAKRYARGRRELEHEFGKTMRYRSIRDLLESDAGAVLLDLKPVWLMSPLSVSDILPLAEGIFDVVLFDEASQIPLEEAVPALFRAPQAIVVGDAMQLPPTSFFAARRDEDEEVAIEQEGEALTYDLSANSFLNQAGKNLPSTLLGWHYRSRSEALISFSNAAFYGGRLLTVPEEELANPAAGEIRIERPEEGDLRLPDLLGRSLSFHRIACGVYAKRRNAAEAAYIARLIRALLKEGEGRTIGVIAFSEEQQQEIESALDRLAREDPEFSVLLDREWEREIDGQFSGLLVKNLENIQGDERDVVLLSVCYGPDPEGKIRMHFGPINQAGGEKRLNVAFTRAKHKMALVTSMGHEAITNVGNQGADALRHYLRFAESTSRGDGAAARSVLEDLCGRAKEEGRPPPPDAVVEELAAAMRTRGYAVDLRIGQSGFRCDAAIYRPGDSAYRLGVLVDTEAHYREADLIERDLMRPRLLEAFGWKVETVLTKDWWEDADAVLRRIDAALGSGGTPPAPPPAPRPAVRRLLSEERFWQIAVDGAAHTIRFGRKGEEGQTLQRSFKDGAEAAADAERLLREKLRQGYREAGGESAPL